MPYRTELVKAENLKSDDIVIALMGLSGSGKTQIIDTLTGQKTRASTSLKAFRNVSAHRVLGHAKYGNKLVLVETPSFDAIHTTDRQTLEIISQWMTKTYKRGVYLTGILYIHRITDIQVSGTAHHNLCMFAELCGDNFAGNVVLLTTMWDRVKDVPAAESKEASLKERYWNVMIHHGATVERFHLNGSGFKSPWLIVDKMIQRHQPRQALLLQEQIVANTGKALSSNLRKLLIKQNRAIELLEGQVEGERADVDIEAEMAALRAEIEEEFENMKTPFGKRVALFFGRAFGKESDRPRSVIHVDEQTARSKNGPEPSSRLEFQMSSTTASFSLNSRSPQYSRNQPMKLPSPVVEQAEEKKEEVKLKPQSEKKHSLLGATAERAGSIVDRDKPDLRSEEHFPSDAAIEQAKETKDKVGAEPRGEEEHPLSDTVIDQGKINPEIEEEPFLSDAATEQPEGVKDEVKAEPPDRSEHLTSDASMGRAAIKDAVRPETERGEGLPLLDEEELLGWEDELPKSRNARCKPAARKTGGRNPKARRWNRSRRVDPIGQLAEVMSCLPLESVQGGLQLTVNVNVTTIHGNFHAAAATTAPNVNNITITNTNSSNPGTLTQDGSEADSDEDDDNETEA